MELIACISFVSSPIAALILCRHHCSSSLVFSIAFSTLAFWSLLTLSPISFSVFSEVATCLPGSGVLPFPSAKYSGINPNCESCHNVPANHIAGIVSNCDKCHSTSGWKSATFDHSKFPLTGKHQSLTCDQCHHGPIPALQRCV